VNVTGHSAYSLYGPVVCRDRERFVSGSKDGLWDNPVGDLGKPAIAEATVAAVA